MGANTFQGIAERAYRAWAQSFGLPIAGKAVSIAFDGTDKTAALEGPATYVIFAITNACYVGQADTTNAANRMLLPVNTPYWAATPAGGLTLHATQVTAGGTLYAAKLDDVG